MLPAALCVSGFIMMDNWRASCAVACSFWYTSLLSTALALPSASWRFGCILDGIPSIADCNGATAVALCLGEEDMVVAAVVAVFGRSEAVIAAAEDGGNLPVSSSFLILDFKSSSSSHTVEGAVVEMVDSVALCSDMRGLSRKAFPSDTKRVLRAVLGREKVRGSTLVFVVEIAAEYRLDLALQGGSAGWEL